MPDRRRPCRAGATSTVTRRMERPSSRRLGGKAHTPTAGVAGLMACQTGARPVPRPVILPSPDRVPASRQPVPVNARCRCRRCIGDGRGGLVSARGPQRRLRLPARAIRRLGPRRAAVPAAADHTSAASRPAAGGRRPTRSPPIATPTPVAGRCAGSGANGGARRALPVPLHPTAQAEPVARH